MSWGPTISSENSVHSAPISKTFGPEAVREAFEARTGVTAPRKIQMILRVGRTPRPFLTYRRHAGDLFVRG